MYSEQFEFKNHLIEAKDIKGQTNSEQALYYGGWNLANHTDDKRDVKVFKTLVPTDGAYKVTITIDNPTADIRDMKVFAGRRNMVLSGINVNKGGQFKADFTTYVSPYYPAMSAKVCDEKAIYISITGENADIDTVIIEETDIPTIFVAGDSTLTDQNAPIPYYPLYSCCGWAQLLGLHFKNIAVCNQAHSGMTTNCFRDDGHWNIVKSHMKKGDIFIMQFGHNDQKRRNLAAFGGYINNLRWYVNEVRKLGAIPIIASPISRVPFVDRGEYHSLLESHALACRQAAMEMDVPFIDLHSLTFKFLCENFENAADYFIKGDITHTNEYGAVKIAEFVATEVVRLGISPLTSYINKEYKPVFNDFDREVMPPAPATGDSKLNIPLPYVDIEGIPEYAEIKKALENWLLDPCVLHLHPNDIMPRAQFLMVYFKAFRLSGKRPYLGEFCDLSRYEWDSSYVQACIDEGLIDKTTINNGRFRPDEALTNGEFASFVVRGLANSVSEREIDMESCFEKAISLNLVPSKAVPSKAITRAQCYAGLVKVMEILDNANEALPEDAEVHPVG
jgi:lysophospholipase L1-like esterase